MKLLFDSMLQHRMYVLSVSVGALRLVWYYKVQREQEAERQSTESAA